MHVAFEDIKAGNMSLETVMIRTQIYLTKHKKEAIERLSDERKTTQRNIIREAIDENVSKKQNRPSKKSIHDFAGIWKDKKDTPNVRKLREGWEQRLNRLRSE